MDNARLVKISKYLSKHLRHRPERLGLTLTPGGWVPVEQLLKACRHHQFPITREELDEVVARNDKQRYAFDETGTLIRANQGHTVPVDLQLEPQTPPATLYHGTSQHSVEGILQEGLRKMSRHHVHLSPDVETALKVGGRRGAPVIFEVDALRMCQAGAEFYCSANGVWLVDWVPPEYLRQIR